MKLLSFPGCCTARVLTGFGQSDTGAWEHRPAKPYTEHSFFEEAKEYLRDAGLAQAAIITATTTEEQTTAIAVLPKLGFICVAKDVKKGAHREHTLSLWVYEVTKEDRMPKPLAANPFAAPVPPQRVVAPVVEKPEIVSRTVLYRETKRLVFLKCPERWPEIRRNLQQVFQDPGVEDKDFQDACLSVGFVWRSTIQRRDYWATLHRILSR